MYGPVTSGLEAAVWGVRTCRRSRWASETTPDGQLSLCTCPLWQHVLTHELKTYARDHTYTHARAHTRTHTHTHAHPAIASSGGFLFIDCSASFSLTVERSGINRNTAGMDGGGIYAAQTGVSGHLFAHPSTSYCVGRLSVSQSAFQPACQSVLSLVSLCLKPKLL